MSVDKQNIVNIFNVSQNQITQIGSKQLFLVEFSDHILIVSYRTIIGIKYKDEIFLTEKEFSKTTSSHMTTIRKYFDNDPIANEEEFQKLLTIIKHN